MQAKKGLGGRASSPSCLALTPPGPRALSGVAYDHIPVVCGGTGRVLKGEDQWVVQETTVQGERLHFVVMADGHGGSGAACYCQAHAVAYMCEGLEAADSTSLRDAGRSRPSRACPCCERT